MDIEIRPSQLVPTDKHRKSEQAVTKQNQKDEVIANIVPLQSIKRQRSARKPKYLTSEDTLWDIVGIDKSTDGPTDVSTNKNKYLAEAYLHERM